MGLRNVRAKRVMVKVNTENADRSRPVLERFDFMVSAGKDEYRLLRFLHEALRRNRILFDDIRVDGNRLWAQESQLWSRRRMEGCISNSGRVADMLEEIYCNQGRFAVA